MTKFTVGAADTINALGHDAVVVEVFGARPDGRIPVLAVRIDTGAEMMPFADECNVIKKHVGHYAPHQISDDTAERFRRWAKVGG